MSDVRQLLSYAGNRELGIPAVEIGRILNVSGQAILQGANKAEETWENLDWIFDL